MRWIGDITEFLPDPNRDKPSRRRAEVERPRVNRWLENGRPGFADHIEVYRKVGHGPANLFMDPEDRSVKSRKKLGLR